MWTVEPARESVRRRLRSWRNIEMGPWLESAKAWGTTNAERDPCEWNARNIITRWAVASFAVFRDQAAGGNVLSDQVVLGAGPIPIRRTGASGQRLLGEAVLEEMRSLVCDRRDGRER